MRRRLGPAPLGLALAAVVVIVLICAGTCQAYVVGDPEFRGLWVDAWSPGFLSQPEVDALLGVPGTSSGGAVRASNLNAVVVQVRRRADTCYPSGMGEPYFEKNPRLSPLEFNALQAIIDAAHDTTGGKQRIEVHAWIVAFACGSASTGSGTVWAAHDDPADPDNYWPTLDQYGNTTADFAFDPGHPRCLKYISDVCMDLVTNFDIDGLNYDYIRFTGSNQGYNPTSIARFNTRYGRTGQPAPTDTVFRQWRRDQVSAVVRQVYGRIQAVKPHVLQSGAFVTWEPSPAASTRAEFQKTPPYTSVFSDWDAWMQEGIMDLGMPMDYYDNATEHADFMNWMNFEKDRQFDRHQIMGLGTYQNLLTDAMDCIDLARAPSPAGNYARGFVIYCYKAPFLTSKSPMTYGPWSTFAGSLIGKCPTPVDVPVRPWKTSPTKGHISGTVTLPGGAWADGATVHIVGPESRTQTCDGTGFYAFIDLTPGTYTVTASLPGYADYSRLVTVELGSVTGNMYVTDFLLADCEPTISNVQSTGVGDTIATISWTTDPAADSQVRYGTTTSYGMTTPLDSNLVTSHSVGLSGLTPKTTYHYQVISSTGPGCSVSSPDYTFTTCGPPTISNVEVTGLTSNAATITWATDTASDSVVDYGLSASYGQQQSNPSYVTSHSITLTGLDYSTTYHYQVQSTGACGTSTTTDFTFTTLSCAPAISSVQAAAITDTSATITWTTDPSGDSRVNYGTTAAYGSQKSSTPYVTSHSITLTGLTPKTTYHYQCESTNGCGAGQSSDYTFTTDGPPVISNVRATSVLTSTATIVWTTDTASDSTVNYGASASYGSQQADPASVTSHSIALTGLNPNTTYHYQCVSANVYGSATSFDYVFRTAASEAILQVDNTDPGWANTSPNGNVWAAGSVAGVPKIGTNYLYRSGDGSLTESSITGKCTWTPGLTISGLYDVYAYYQIGTNRNTAAPYKVYYHGGSQTSVQNQNGASSTGGWFLLASNVPCAAGGTNYVELTTLSLDAKYVSADAAKWVLKSVEDINPPVISGAGVSAITTNSAIISWTTDLYSDSTVNYGVTAGYGSQQSNGSYVTAHSVALTGLQPGTTYHYQCSSANGVGPASTGDLMFTTLSKPVMVSVTDGKYVVVGQGIEATWLATDPLSTIVRYEYAVGETPGSTEITDWTDAGAATSVTLPVLPIQSSQVCYVSARAVNADGVTSEPMNSAGVTVVSVKSSIQQAKQGPDWPIKLPALVVSAKFPTCFYIEEANRVSGIRVESADAVSVGQMVTVYGMLGLVGNCERAILDPRVDLGAPGTAIQPLLITAGTAGGSGFGTWTPGITGGTGLNNTGLLVKLYGHVVGTASDGFYLSDGSKITSESGGQAIKVYTGTSDSPGTYVTVTGIVSCYKSGATVYPVIMPTLVTPM